MIVCVANVKIQSKPSLISRSCHVGDEKPNHFEDWEAKVKKEEEKDGKMTLQISSTGLVFGYFLWWKFDLKTNVEMNERIDRHLWRWQMN